MVYHPSKGPGDGTSHVVVVGPGMGILFQRAISGAHCQRPDVFHLRPLVVFEDQWRTSKPNRNLGLNISIYWIRILPCFKHKIRLSKLNIYWTCIKIWENPSQPLTKTRVFGNALFVCESLGDPWCWRHRDRRSSKSGGRHLDTESPRRLEVKKGKITLRFCLKCPGCVFFLYLCYITRVMKIFMVYYNIL